MTSKNYYAILGVSPTATVEEIREAYLRRSRVIHPDRFDPKVQPIEWRQANEMLQELNEAYKVLREPASRSRFDAANDVRHDHNKKSTPKNAKPRSSQSSQSSPSIRLGRLLSGYIKFSEAPPQTKQRLLDRERNKIREQYKVWRKRVFRNYFFVAVLTLWFWQLIFFASVSRWTSNSLWWKFAITIAVSLLIGVNLAWIIKWHQSKIKCNFFITPLYFIMTELDEIWYWPIWDLQEIGITHNYTNRSYQDSTVHLRFPDAKEDVLLSDEGEVRSFIEAIRVFERKIKTAKEQEDWAYFFHEDDFREVTPKVAEKKSVILTPTVVVSHGISLIVGLVLLNVAYLINLQQPSMMGIPPQQEPHTQAKPITDTEPPTTKFNEVDLSAILGNQIQPLPRNGDQSSYVVKEAIAPLTIVTRANGNHYFVKITDWYTNETVATIFIRDGQTVETLLPLGSYKIKYAIGETWYGEQLLFGPNTSYSEAEKRFDFTMSEDVATGYTVELFLQRDGNLHTKKIFPSEW